LHLLLLVLSLLLFKSAAAHDIGVSQASLIEQENGRYALNVQTGPGLLSLFAAPVLPEHCALIGNPRGIQSPRGLSYEFSCTPALTATDSLILPWRRDGIMLSVSWLDGSEVQRLFSHDAGNISVPLEQLQASSGNWIDVAERYTSLGIEHILMGIDHLLFVLALLLIVRGPWMLLKTITAFTVAHSLTLGMATLGLVNISPRPVEAAIALSIVFLCTEIVHAHRGRIGMTFRYPWVVAFAFGLLHGLGFASALTAIGLAQGEIPLALLFFNIGVEIGQLLFVGALLMIAWCIQQLRLNVGSKSCLVSAYVIGTVAAFWLLERVTLIYTPI